MIVTEVRQCFLAAIEDGRPATFINIWRTIEGDRVTTQYVGLPTGDVQVFIDRAGSPYQASTWTQQRCTGLQPSSGEVFVLVGCQEALVTVRDW